MPEELKTADGKRLDLDDSDRAFAAAMAAPRGDEPEAPAPPKRDPVDPAAPHGRKADGTPKKGPGGRPPKPREIEAPKPPQGGSGPGPAGAAADYTQGLAEFTDALWMVLAAAPVPDGPWRVRVRAQAYVLRANQGGVVTGVNAMAQHNGTIRAGVEKLTTGSAGWVLPAVMALAPFAVQSAMIWRVPPNGDMERIAAETEAAWEQQLAAMKAEFAAEQDQATDQPGEAA